ncbi:EF-hand calcium-binding domain-containing protein 6 [Plectropomus leopardus]|uniref:EF-hand calcium-binding domain-containing protein 6 n=1 Tax=Plectropomus leopardus TaxID=160734 RepID=UPI001C4BB9D7|nr:EF-hand calcium-binding domain-containing protein 6 [Plectropomus leopardus]
MAKLLPLQPGPGLDISPRPHTAPGRTTHLSTRGQTRGGSRQTGTDRGPQLILEQVKPLIHSRLSHIRSAFMAADPDGTGLVSSGEFRRVLKSLLSVSQNQLDTVLNQVCERGSATVDYMQFLRRFSRAPAVHRACSSYSSVSELCLSVCLRRGPQSTPMSLSEIQRHLKEKIGGNLRTVIRVFGLFDYNRKGHVQRHEFRRILDNYCIHLTDKEFERLWNHYSPNNTSTISYELFLDQLGFSDSHNLRIAPVCTKLEVSRPGTTPPDRVKQKKQRPESISSLRPRTRQTLFYDKMCMNCVLLWRALQAFDTSRSGLVEQDVLRAVLSSFVFPMNPHSFQKLTSRYGVRVAGPVRWKHFLGHFMSPMKEEGDTDVDTDRSWEHPAAEANGLDLQDINPRLREIFHLLDTREAGYIPRAELRHFLERPGRTLPRCQQPQITELLNALDPEHSGVIQRASLERLSPSITNTAPPPATAEDTAEDAEHTALSSVLAALKLCDPQHTGYVTQEDLKKVLSCCGAPVSDTHFNKLCETSSSTSDSSPQLVSYRGFLRSLGVPLTDETSSFHEDTSHTESRCSSPQSTLPSVRGQRPRSSLQVSSHTCSILDTVFKRMRSRLEQRHSSLTERIQALTHSSEGTLSETDVRKILEDSWVVLDDKNFHEFTELLGLRDGGMECSVFLVKYEEATARDGQQRSESQSHQEELGPLLTSAEQCLAAMKTRIKIIHGDNLTAFCLMDRKRKGVVDCRDFRELYSSLGLLCRENEYERLLDLIGLHPGANINYTEFVDIVENNGKCKPWTQTACVQEQLHQLLATEVRYKWADMCKVLCQFDTDGQGWIHKAGLRGLLFTYALPISPEEFDQFWLRYDLEGRGRVAVCDFLKRLGFHHEGELRARSQKLKQTVAQQNAGRPLSSDAASLQSIEAIVQKNYAGLSDSLTRLETRRDGTVTVDELISVLQTYSCSISRQKLINHLRRLHVSMDDSGERLAYMDFLSAFEQKAEEKCERPPVTPDAVRQSLDSLSPAAALARMREIVTASASTLDKVFSAFDCSGTGTVKALEFRQVLESFCACLSDKQYRYMLTKLELDCESCTVNWRDFLNKFQSQSPLLSQRCPIKTCEKGSKPRSPLQTNTSGVTQLQEVVSGHLYDMTEELLDLDPFSSTTISKEQFRQLCDRHCLRLTNDQFECVWSQMPVNKREKLQYREFMERFGEFGRTEAGGPNDSAPSASCQPRETAPATSGCPETTGGALQRTKSAPQISSRHPASVGRPGTGSPAGSVERRLRGAVQRCWKEIQRKCTEEDPQREGHISTSSFLEILQSLSVTVTQEQFERLAVKFDIISNGRVSYHNFLHHFVLNLKPAEARAPFERRKLPPPTTLTSRGVLSRDCMEVMLRIHDIVHASWTSIRRCFLSSDRARTGSVTVQDFRKVLHHFSIKLSEDEFFHLCSYFDGDTTGRISFNDFLWAFLH